MANAMHHKLAFSCIFSPFLPPFPVSTHGHSIIDKYLKCKQKHDIKVIKHDKMTVNNMWIGSKYTIRFRVIKLLQVPYLDWMVGNTSSGFSALVLASERIENMIKMGKIQNDASTSGVLKKPYVSYWKKREGEANETVVVRGRAPTYRAPYQQVVIVSQNLQPFTIPIDQRAIHIWRYFFLDDKNT